MDIRSLYTSTGLNMLLETMDTDVISIELRNVRFPSINFLSIDKEKFQIRYYDANRFRQLRSAVDSDIQTSDFVVSVRYRDLLMEGAKYAYSGKPGKVVRKLLGDKFTDAQYEAFVTKLKAASIEKEPSNIEVIEGEAIRTAYHYKSYSQESRGTLNLSCMRHNVCSPYFDIYVCNPDVVKMVVARDSAGLIAGRCLLWFQGGSPIAYDRIYYTRLRYELQIENYIKHKYGVPCCYDSSESFTVTVAQDVTDYDYLPYMDSFAYAHGNVLTTTEDSQHTLVLQSIMGSYYQNDNYFTCSNCDNAVDNDNEVDNVAFINGNPYCMGCAVYSDYNNEYLFRDDAIQTEQGWVSIEQAYDCELDGNFYCEGHATWSDYHETFIPNEEVTRIGEEVIWLLYVTQEELTQLEGMADD